MSRGTERGARLSHRREAPAPEPGRDEPEEMGTQLIRLDTTSGVPVARQPASPLPFRPSLPSLSEAGMAAALDYPPPTPVPPRVVPPPVPPPRFGLPPPARPPLPATTTPLPPAPLPPTATPLPSAPLHSAPLHSAPLPSAPLPPTATPLPSAPPLHSAPLHSAPLHSAPLHSAPLPSSQLPPPAAPPFMQPPQGGTTIGQQFSLTQRPAAELPRPVIAEPAAAPAGQRASQPKLRAVELLWAAEDAEQRARRAPAVAGAFEPAAAAEDAAERKDASPRAVHRALARLAPADDIEKALWDAVDEDGVLSPPVVLVSGELELLFDDAELVKALVPLLRPFAEGDGELGERLDSAAGTAERLPDASRLVARELAALRRLWDEREVPVPMADLEAEARRILLARRRLRSIDIFEGQHLVALLRTEAHDDPLPVYLPAAARGRLPLESRFDARLLVQLFPRQAADEPCPLAAAALAVARVVRP